MSETHSPTEDLSGNISSVKDRVEVLARTHDVSVEENPMDRLGQAITRLADDRVDTDGIERLIVHLGQGGHLSAEQVVDLLAGWQDEKLVEAGGSIQAAPAPQSGRAGMVFDPFGDFDQRGYLRNRVGRKSSSDVKTLEHHAFLSQLPGTLEWLAEQPLTYETILAVHGRLFAGLYPWAGLDRRNTTPDRTVRKGNIYFSDPDQIRIVAEHALRQKTPGGVLSELALAHPFLDGNGRTLFTFFGEHQHRQGRRIRWENLQLDEVGSALTDGIYGNHKPLDRLIKKHSVRTTEIGSVWGFFSDSKTDDQRPAG